MQLIMFFLVLLQMVMVELVIGAETDTTPICILYSPGRIEVAGTAWDLLYLYAVPDSIVAPVKVEGIMYGWNTVFEFVPDASLNCFTFEGKGRWATIGSMAIMQWHEASQGRVGGGSVFKVKPIEIGEDDEDDDEFIGFCLRLKDPIDPRIFIKLEY